MQVHLHAMDCAAVCSWVYQSMGHTLHKIRTVENLPDKGTSLEFTVCGARTLFRPHPQPLSHAVGEGCRGARRCDLRRIPPRPPAGEGDKGGEGTLLEFTVCGARTLFCPHPQPLSHAVGEGCRGARRCDLRRIPPRPPAGEGDKGGEGNTVRLPVHACAGENSPCFKDFVPNRCTLTRPEGGGRL